jgi:anti-sigma-K factor RskA
MMDKREHLIELLPAYALDILDEAETLLVSLHISECETCREEYKKYQEASKHLSYAVAEAEPPQRVKARLMEAVQPYPVKAGVQKNSSWQEKMPILANTALRAWAVVSLVLVAALLVSNILLWQQISRPEITDSLRVVALTGGDYVPHARGMLTMSIDGQQGTVVVDGLAHLEDEFEYQIWLIRADEISNGGTFMVYRDGYGYKRVESEKPLMNFESFMLTIEPTGGSLSPTGPVVLTGEL